MKNLFIIISILLNMSPGCDGCKKQPKNCNGYVAYPYKMKDYFMFKDSSYWIYQDSISGDIDSFWVNNFKKVDIWPYKLAGTRKSPCYEIIEYRIYRKLNSNYEEVELSSSFSNNGAENERFYVDYYLRNDSNILKYETRFASDGYDAIDQDTLDLKGYNVKYKSIVVNNKTYNDVIFHYEPYYYSGHWIRNIYYAKNIGAIKFKDADGRVWKLIRHKVKQ